MACLSKSKKMQTIWIVALGLLMMNKAIAGFFDWHKDPLLMEPKAEISLDYPSQWDHNKLIALSNEGSRLIDASENG